MARRRPRSKDQVTTEDAILARPIGRREWVAIAGIVLLAIAMRFAYPNRMAIEHFDEGVYASNIFFSEAEGGQYPYRHLYAPPLLPFLIEWGIIFLGPDSIAPFLPALILGTATVPLAWWAVRSWFGPLAGVAAAWLIGTSDFHILYSRTALTDVPVAFFILLAVHLYWEAVRRESLRWSIAAGVATGLAWWTKYTGWLPLAIALAGSIPWVITERRAAGVSLPSRAKNIAACFATMAVVAFLVWSPVLWYLQPYGGYAAVAENHRGYLRPASEWGHNAAEQSLQLAWQSGNLTVAAVAVFGFLVPVLAKRHLVETVILGIWCASTVAWSAFELGPAFPLVLIGFSGALFKFATLFLVPDYRPMPSRSATPLALWLLTTWLVGLTITTPLYTPYSRLALPWLISATLIAGAWLWNVRDTDPKQIFQIRTIYAFAAVVLLVIPAVVIGERKRQASPYSSLALTKGWVVPGWENRTRLRFASELVGDVIRRDRGESEEPAVVYVYRTIGDPATFFHMSVALASDNIAVVPAGTQSELFEQHANFDIYVVTSIPNRTILEQRKDGRLVDFLGSWVLPVSERVFTLPSTVARLDTNRLTRANFDVTSLRVLKLPSE